MRSRNALACALVSLGTAELFVGTIPMLAATNECISTLSTDSDARSSLTSAPVNENARSHDDEDPTAPKNDTAKIKRDGKC